MGSSVWMSHLDPLLGPHGLHRSVQARAAGVQQPGPQGALVARLLAMATPEATGSAWGAVSVSM